jgi:hypothetical protein
MSRSSPEPFVVGGLLLAFALGSGPLPAARAAPVGLQVVEGAHWEGPYEPTAYSGPINRSVSPDASHVALGVADGKQFRIWLDGKLLGPYLEIIDSHESKEGRAIRVVEFSDTGHHAFVAIKGDGAHVVHDGIESQTPCDGVYPDTLKLSGLGTGYAAEAQIADKSFLLQDGSRAGAAFEDLQGTTIRYGPNGTSMGLLAKVEGRWALVVDGKAGPKLTDDYPSSASVISPDLARAIVVARFEDGDAKRMRATVDGVVYGPYDEIEGLPSFSADGKRWAFVARNAAWQPPKASTSRRVVSDGVEHELCGEVKDLLWSPDGKHLAYTASWVADGAWRMGVVLDGKRLDASAAWPHSLTFSADGKRFGFVRHVSKDGKTGSVLVLDGTETGPAVDRIGNVALSADGAHVAYVATVRGRNPMERPTTNLVVDGSSRLAGERFPLVTFSPDGRHVLCMTGQGGTLSLVAIPVGEGEPLASPLTFDMSFSTAFAWPSAKNARLMVRRGKDVIRLDVALP